MGEARQYDRRVIAAAKGLFFKDEEMHCKGVSQEASVLKNGFERKSDGGCFEHIVCSYGWYKD